MSRKDLSADEENTLQEPIMKALDEYFDASYEPGDKFGSVASGFESERHAFMFVAYRVPPEHITVVQTLIGEQAALFGESIKVTIDREPLYEPNKNAKE